LITIRPGQSAAERKRVGSVKAREERNGLRANFAGAIIRSLEALSLRGGPTILKFLWNVPPLREVTATLPLTHAGKIVFPAFDAYWSRHLWARVPYERDVEQIFRKIGQGRALIDCGANIGYWSIRASEFGFTHVIAVEANSRLIPLLRENFRINGIDGEVHQSAIHCRSGEEMLLEMGAGHAQGHIGASGTPVMSVTITDLAAQVPAGNGIVAKLDVEGCEIPAIDGAAGVESIIFVYEDFRERGMEVTASLLDRGLRIFAVLPDGEHAPIGSVDEAMKISTAIAAPGSPANLVACDPSMAPRVQRELSAR
jgi:FkbM family methyltransferase